MAIYIGPKQGAPGRRFVLASSMAGIAVCVLLIIQNQSEPLFWAGWILLLIMWAADWFGG